MSATKNPYQHVFEIQKANQYQIGNSTYSERIKKLNTLKRAIGTDFKNQIKDALKKDLGKPSVEAELSEIYPIISDIKYVKRHLHQWMKKQRVQTPLSMLGASSYYTYESKGICLIISPWNFPINLTFGPLISAIAAGNTVIIKPSEMTPNCSAVMAKIINTVFDNNEVALIEGEVDTATALLELPFNHIFFTGSPTVGKIVMNAASKHLASVTLELGGKSPTLVDTSVNINKAAKKIVWAKFLNCGQTCIAPDYILIDETIKTPFIEACKRWINHYFTENPELSVSYGRIVNAKHFKRLKAHLENAKASNAQIEIGDNPNEKSNYISPTIISNLKENASLLEDEIFGPLLPIVTYKTLDEAITYINTKERPLALYIYSKNKTYIKRVMANTRAGGTCINNSIIHYSNHNLPFGGINNSGIGKSHGFFGFEAFSNKRAVVKQHTFGVTELLFPPYTDFKEKLAKLTVKWF